MATKIDGRAYRVDVRASIHHDSDNILISGWPATYLDGATATCPIYAFGLDTQVSAWSVNVDTDTPSVTLSLPQSDLETLGAGTYDYELLLQLEDGSEPAIIGGQLVVTRDHRRVNNNVSQAVDVVPTGVTLTIEQVLADGLSVIDGGIPAGVGSGIVDGGAP